MNRSFAHPSLDDLIDAPAVPAMRAHLASCPACRDEVRRWHATAGVLRQLWAGGQPPPWNPRMLPDAAGTGRGWHRRCLARLAGDAGPVRRDGRSRRRRVAVRAAMAAAAVTAAAAIAAVTFAAATAARPGGGAAQARLTAYVTKRVENALASENLVFVGRSDSRVWGNSVTWAYGSRNRFEEYWPVLDFRNRVVNGRRLWDFPLQDRGRPYLATGTALAGGRLVSAYVTYPDRKYSLSPLTSQPAAACSVDTALGMGAPVIPTTHWADFIDATLRCGAASVTGHVVIDGVETTKITGKPVTVRLSPGYARAVHEQWATARWILYVNPGTYLPVRMYGSTETFGGTAGRHTSSFVTDVRWLPPTRANIARAMVTIPRGFQRVNSAADQ